MPTTPTRAQVDAAEPTLGATAKANWLALIRQSRQYMDNVSSYPALNEATFAGLTELQNKQLNAALDLIEGLPALDAEIDRDEDAIKFSVADQRASLVEFGISVLFPPPDFTAASDSMTFSDVIRSPARY